MTTTSSAAFTPGAGDQVATYSIVENDGAGNVTKKVERVSINKSDGTEALPLGAQGTGSQYNPPTGGSDLLGYASGIYAASIDTSDQGVQVNGTKGREYETVAASQTNQSLGATGAIGDDLDGLLIVPATTSPGIVSIKDGSGSAITVFAGGSSSVSNLVPFPVPLGLRSVSGAWQVTTGANVSVIGIGNFT